MDLDGTQDMTGSLPDPLAKMTHSDRKGTSGERNANVRIVCRALKRVHWRGPARLILGGCQRGSLL